MKKRNTFVVLLLAMVVVLPLQATVDADSARLVRLTSRGSAGGASVTQIPYNVEPEILLVEPNTVVVWTLFGAFEAQILFLDGKKCQAATEAPVGFQLESGETTACYRGVLIPNGGTASLKFKEKGVYEYSIKWANTPRKTRAKVVVY
jgi:hypothetical protein